MHPTLGVLLGCFLTMRIHDSYNMIVITGWEETMFPASWHKNA